MEYAVFNIDDSRKLYTDAIRARLAESFWFNEQTIRTVNANNEDELIQAQKYHHFRLNWQAEDGPRKGHMGVWYSVLNALEWVTFRQKSLVTFEDDAILHERFNTLFWETTSRLPEDTDAFSLFLPRDQDRVHARHASVLHAGPGICKAYQIYGGVSMLWTPRGAAKFRTLVRKDGIQDQWDNQLYRYARKGKLNVYTQTPTNNVLVGITGRDTSIVQESAYL